MSETFDASPELDVEQPTTVDEPSDNKWWVASDNQPTGPFNEAYVTASIRSGVIATDQLICPVGANAWRPACAWPQMQDHIPQRAAAPPVARPINSPLPVTVATPPVDWVRLGVIYGLLVNPMTWCLAITVACSGRSLLSREAPNDGIGAVIDGFQLLAYSGLAVMWFIGGWWLRCNLKRGFWTVLAAGVATNLYVVTVIIGIGSFVIDTTDPPSHQNSDVQNALAVLQSAIGLLEYAFTNVLVAMLWMKRKTIPWADRPFH